MIYDNAPRSVDMLYDWTPDKMVEVMLDTPDDFLKVRETLTRIGIVGKRPDEHGKLTLTQSCHLLHKKGRYFVVNYKEMFLLDGRESNLSVSDIERRNLIIGLLADWGLVKVALPDSINIRAPMSAVRVIPHKEKHLFSLQAKYAVGNARR